MREGRKWDKIRPAKRRAGWLPNFRSCDMTRRDLVFLLENLQFTRRRDQVVAVEIDAGVRDYLVTALTRR